jgi:hypothetical protein
LISKDYFDPMIQANIPFWPFQVCRSDESSGELTIEVLHNQRKCYYTAIELLSFHVQYVKELVEKFVRESTREEVPDQERANDVVEGEEYTGVVITCTSAIDIKQIQSIRQACLLAGIDDICFHSVASMSLVDLVVKENNSSSLSASSSLDRLALVFHVSHNFLHCTFASIESKSIELQDTKAYEESSSIILLLLKEFQNQLKARRFKSIQDFSPIDKVHLRLSCEQAKDLLLIVDIVEIQVEAYNI